MKAHAISTQKPATRIGRRGAAGAIALHKRRQLKGAAALISIVVIIALFYVWSRVAVVQTGYRLHHLANEYQQLEDQYRALKLEIATRTSPDRLGSFARKKLGLKPPKPNQVVILPEPIRIAEQRK